SSFSSPVMAKATSARFKYSARSTGVATCACCNRVDICLSSEPLLNGTIRLTHEFYSARLEYVNEAGVGSQAWGLGSNASVHSLNIGCRFTRLSRALSCHARLLFLHEFSGSHKHGSAVVGPPSNAVPLGDHPSAAVLQCVHKKRHQVVVKQVGFD